MKLCVSWKVHLPSAANEREMPIAQWARQQKQRGGKDMGISGRMDNALFHFRNKNGLDAFRKPPFKITLTRIATRELDGDNLQYAFKNIRDGVCESLGLPNDKDGSKVTFSYAQEHGENEIRIDVECE